MKSLRTLCKEATEYAKHCCGIGLREPFDYNAQDQNHFMLIQPQHLPELGKLNRFIFVVRNESNEYIGVPIRRKELLELAQYFEHKVKTQWHLTDEEFAQLKSRGEDESS